MSLTTAQLEAAALSVPCPVHEVPAGTRCRVLQGGALGDACMTRREIALAEREDER
jgi:hypothetical protein